MTERDDSQEINLRQYLAVVRQKYWLVLIAIAVAVVPAVIFLVRAEPVYEASSRVLIEQSRALIDKEGPRTPGIYPEIE